MPKNIFYLYQQNIHKLKTKLIIPALFIFTFVFINCKKYDALGNEIKTYSEIKKANWFIGTWQHKTDTTNLIENWTFENDSTLTATSYFVQNNKDTLHNETIELVQTNNVLIYYATVLGTNNNEPIPYQKTIDTENELIFENPKQNYPQKISYKKMATAQILISISGKVNGNTNNETYILTKNK